MRYNAPYGNANNDAGYVNGNPSTGTMGSIPPAESIEQPQREIVALIADSALTPDGADLRQLSKSVQGGKVNYCPDAGTANFINISPVPPVAAYVVGQHFRVKMAQANTGPVQINVSAVGWKPVIHGDGSAMGGGELYQGQVIEVAYNGTNWQMMTGGVSGALIMMTAPRDFYVNSITGDDSLYDGSQAAVDAPNGHGPFKSLRRALNTVSKYNLSGFPLTFHLADGTYSDTAILSAPIPNGSGDIQILGNPGSPNLVKIINSGNGSCFQVKGGRYLFDGVTFQATQSTLSDSGVGLWVTNAASAWLYAVGFYAAPTAHIVVANGGAMAIQGPIGIYGGASVAHMVAQSNGTINVWPTPNPTLTIYNPVTFQSFVNAAGGGQMAPVYAAINNPGQVSGLKYAAASNGVIDTGGRGASYLPGTGAGVVSTGGQYV